MVPPKEQQSKVNALVAGIQRARQKRMVERARIMQMFVPLDLCRWLWKGKDMDPYIEITVPTFGKRNGKV